jgi:hypothetical protein
MSRDTLTVLERLSGDRVEVGAEHVLPARQIGADSSSAALGGSDGGVLVDDRPAARVAPSAAATKSGDALEVVGKFGGCHDGFRSSSRR